jgi:hypothetical protein
VYCNHEKKDHEVKAPVLQIHGMQDQFLLPGGLNNTWEWLEKDWTLLTAMPVTLSNTTRPGLSQAAS